MLTGEKTEISYSQNLFGIILLPIPTSAAAAAAAAAAWQAHISTHASPQGLDKH